MTNRSIRVVLGDDHPIVLDGLMTMLGAASNIQVVGVGRSFNEALDLLDRVAADVLVLDLGGMGGSPLTLVHRVQREHAKLAIVVFSSSVDLAPELLHAGVCGYVAKEDLSGQLVAAIQAVHMGQQYLSQAVREYMLQATVPNERQLSPKELTVLKLLSQGRGNSAIAEQMGIDPRSVQNYVTGLYRKIGCAERIQLVDWYRRIYGISA